MLGHVSFNTNKGKKNLKSLIEKIRKNVSKKDHNLKRAELFSSLLSAIKCLKGRKKK